MSKRFNTSKTGPPPNPFAAADDNTNPAWLENLAAIGLTPVVIEVQPSNELWTQPRFAEEIGAELEGDGLGSFDSSRVVMPPADAGADAQSHYRHFLYVRTKKLAAALESVRAKLEQRNLLASCKIGHADPDAGVWRTFYPGVKGTPAQ